MERSCCVGVESAGELEVMGNRNCIGTGGVMEILEKGVW